VNLIVLFLVLAAAIAGFIGFVVLRHWTQRLRGEVRQLRTAAGAVRAIEEQMELLYQTARPAPTLPEPGNGSPFDKGAWSVLAGDGAGWTADTFYKVRGLAVHDGMLLAGLTGPNADGPLGQVWRFDGQAWSQVGGDIGGSWNADQSFVDHLHSKGSAGLFVAEKTGVWRLQSDRWTLMRDGLELNDKCGPYSFADWNGNLVMGQWGHPRVALLGNDGRWSYLPDPKEGWGAGVRTIYCLVAWNGYLYAGTGTGKFTGPASAVWRYDGQRWEKVGGSGVRGSWAREGIPFVLSLTIFGDRLVATLSRPDNTHSAASNVWVFDGEHWGALAVGATPALMAGSLIMNDAIVFQGRLVVATGHGTRDRAQIWELASGQCWRPVGPPALDVPAQGDGGWWVYRLCTDGQHLYASTAGHRGAARVLRFTSTDGNQTNE
jgi:hypothetical protein